MKREYYEAMDHLTFTEEAKDRMAKKFSQLDPPGKRVSLRKAAALSLAAAALGALLAGAGWVSTWEKTIPQTQHTTIAQQHQAEQSGLSYRPDAIAVTSGGITVTLRQYLVDSHSVRLSFRVEGAEIPEGEHPMFQGNHFTFDGKALGGSSGGSFEMGIYENTQGDPVYADGSPIETEPDGSWIPRYEDADGSLEYSMYFQTAEDLTACYGKEIRIELEGLVLSDIREDRPISDGPWVFSWTLEGSGEIRLVDVGRDIGTTGVILNHVKLSPINLEVDLTLPEVFAGFDTLEPFYLSVAGVRTKDGVIHEEISPSGTDHYVDRAAGRFRMIRAWDGILSPQDVDAIAFFDSRTQETHLVPFP